MEGFLAALKSEIEDASEETFELFSNSVPLRDLGMVDPRAAVLELSVAGHDFTLTQSPGILQSNRHGGTTGAALWQTSVRFAERLASPKNALTKHGLLQSKCTVLELGSGISGLVPCALSPLVERVIATDQQYVLKMLQANIESNESVFKHKASAPGDRPVNGNRQRKANVEVFALDWEQDDFQSFMKSIGLPCGVDVLLACDCVFNFSLTDPLVQMCVDICKMRRLPDGESSPDIQPTICLVAQQLRQSEVFERWLELFMRSYHVWRMPNDMLIDGLKEGTGFSLHVGILR